MLQDGDFVGRYEIKGVIGEGGFGNVYRAWDDQLKRFVAIKELRSELKAKSETQYEKYRERFALESRIQSQFEDVPIVRVYDLVSQNGNEYLVEEFIDGGNLRDLLRKEGRLSPERVVNLGEEMCQAISAIWAVRIVHRDIKPGNILLKSNGHAKLADFGVAQMEELSKRTESAPSPQPGTPAYKSPEQESGLGYLTDRSDIYTLGLVLYEALTGKLYKNEGAPVSKIAQDVPKKLDAAIMRALRDKPSDRYQDAEEFEMALRGSLNGNGRKWPVWFIGIVVFLLLLGIVISVAPGLAPAGTLAPTATPTVTSSPPATPAATATPALTPTQTLTPTPTESPSPTPTVTRPTPTPVPAVSSPRLTSPNAGSTVNGTQLLLRWAGSYPARNMAIG